MTKGNTQPNFHLDLFHEMENLITLILFVMEGAGVGLEREEGDKSFLWQERVLGMLGFQYTNLCMQ